MVRRVGVEEELLLVDPETGALTAVATEAISASELEDGPPVEAELFLQQVETQTPPCTSLDDLATELRRSRRAVCEAAEAAGAAAAALAVPVLVDDRETKVTPKPRYLRIRDQYAELVRSSLTCAMHVHVEIDDPEQGVRVLDGIAPWLPVLLAISANSPYYRCHDTGYASYRSQLWSRLPSGGTREPFGDLETYREVIDRTIEWGAALDQGMAYFDARLAQNYPTVELRVPDVCAGLDDTLLVAALSRALITVAVDAEVDTWRSELLRVANWRASRHGLADRLVDPSTRSLAPAREVINSLVEHVQPALEEADDLDQVHALIERLFATGNGATHQRRVFETTGSLEAVVDDAVRRTREPAEAR
jgi:glutamate---cysteine ligase / carboxylate-amine ligase